MLAMIKTLEEINTLKENQEIVKKIHREIQGILKAGLPTEEIEELVLDLLYENQAKPAFDGYRGYNHAVCISINDEILHGSPKGKILKEGDLVSIDVGVYRKGYYGDGAFSTIIGKAKKEDIALVKTTKLCLTKAKEKAKIGNTTEDIGKVIEKTARENGFNVIREYAGHAIGKELHEEPLIHNYETGYKGLILKAGMVICIEPILTIGSGRNCITNDNWTVVTVDGTKAAHFEDMVVI